VQELLLHLLKFMRVGKIYGAASFVREPSSFDVQTAAEKSKTYELSCAEQIPAELIQARGETLRLEIHKPFNYVRNKEELPRQ
jgi:hypothetical protein